MYLLQKGLQNPIVLLLTTGLLIGLNFPLGKVAVEAGVSPILWSALISFGAALTLVPILLLQRDPLHVSATTVRYSLFSGLITFVIANVLVFTVIPHVGSGFIGIMFALSPVFTLAISVLFRLKAPGLLGIVGIIFGLLGATIVAWSRQASQADLSLWWMLAAIAVPLTLAIGNVYRTVAWPEGASPDQLAFWSHLFSLMLLLLILLIVQGAMDFGQLFNAPLATIAQIIIAGLTFPVFFRLQKYGGPVLLSQLGYVASAVGLFAATLFLGETYQLLTWGGAGVIAIGIACTVLAQRSKP